jgi:tripartite motif-containing protein 71
VLFLLAIFLCLGSIGNNVFCRLYSVEKYLFVTDWGSLGTSNGQFDKPHEIAVDSSGKVYVADTENNRIQKFSSNGTFIAKWGSTCNLHISVGCTNPSNHLDEGDGQFNSPTSVAVNPSSGNVYVADYGNSRIQEFTSSGIFLKWWGFEGQLDGYFTAPSSVAVNPSSGNVYVADTGNNRIQEFTSSGIFIAKWGSSGSGDGQFIGPSSVAVNPSSGNVYVADYGNSRIQVFTVGGTFITELGSYGSGNYQFNGPKGVAVDPSSGNVYVSDIFNNRIQVFALMSTFTYK